MTVEEIINRSMALKGQTTQYGLGLMAIAVKASQTRTSPTGIMIGFGTYIGRVSMLLGLCARPGEHLHLVDQADYLDTVSLDREKISYTFFRQTSESYVESTQGNLINISHHDASHFFENVRTELTGVEACMNPNGLIILDDFSDSYSQVRAAYYYLRYSLNFPWELALVGFEKGVLVHETQFDFWESWILRDLQDEFLSMNVDTVLHRTDVSKFSKAFYLKNRNGSEPRRYGLNIWGNKFYLPSGPGGKSGVG